MAERVPSESGVLTAVIQVLESIRHDQLTPVARSVGQRLGYAIARLEALSANAAAGYHRNPGTLAIYGNPPTARQGSTLEVTLQGTLGYVEQLKYDRTTKPAGPYFHDFGPSDALWMGELADGQKVLLLVNVNGKPLWGKG